MSEDIHKWATDGRYTLMFDEHTFFVWDNEKDDRMTALEVTEKLNEQQDTIFKLQNLCGESDGENAKLRIENKQLKEEMVRLHKMSIELMDRVIPNLRRENEQLRQQNRKLYKCALYGKTIGDDV